jgi:glycosyltransferase involved in cell wall biosynthesis
MTQEKITVMVISDHPLSPSGVGTQTRYMIEAMLKTGKYRFICLGGAVKHEDYTPTTVEGYGEDWIIFPIDGYGNQEMIRSFLVTHKPDILWFMTDPRFYGWLWEIENEIRAVVPMIYYHVWDNYPYPSFNQPWYSSNDIIVSISKVTSDIVRNVSPRVEEHYLPHATKTDIFKKISDEQIRNFKIQSLPNVNEDNVDDKLIFFWNSRNARRKMSGSLLWWFKDYLDEVGHDKAMMVMHTDPKDAHGQDLIAIMEEQGLNKGQILLSTNKVGPENLAMMYNMADCTLGISDAEGFGLSTFESLACETPIIVNMTGGLQEQVTDGKDWFGIGIEPASKAIIGSQEVPYIYEDRINKEDFVNALVKITKMSREERSELGRKGRAHVEKNYSMRGYAEKWDQILSEAYEKYGSWENRKHYQSWECMEMSQ